MANETKKYLDLAGLGIYNEKLKTWVSTNFNKYDDSALVGRVSDLEELTKDYATVVNNATNGQTAYTALTIFLGNVTADAAPTLAQIDNVFKTVTINGKRLISDAYADNKVVLTGDDIAVSATDSTKLSTKISAIDIAISEIEVTAEGDDYVAATASDKKVTVSATEKLQNAVASAESALQKEDIKEGSVNGTISVKDADVVVHGLGSAAYTDSDAYDVAGAASDAEQNAKDYADDEIKKLNATTLKMSDAEDASSISKEITDLKSSISGGTFFRGVVSSKDEIEDPKNGDIIVVGNIEWIWDAGSEDWIELGDSTANSRRISELESGKLDKAATAVDSDKLGGQSPSFYATKTDLESYALKTDIPVAYTTAEVEAGIVGWFA